jgi:hypothetical protein
VDGITGREDQKRSEEQVPGFCWAVVFGLTNRPRLDLLFATRALAEKRAGELGEGWRVERWAIQGWKRDQP